MVEVELSAEDAATLIMSAGVVQPGSSPDPKKLAALAGVANAARIANAAVVHPEPAKVECASVIGFTKARVASGRRAYGPSFAASSKAGDFH